MMSSWPFLRFTVPAYVDGSTGLHTEKNRRSKITELCEYQTNMVASADNNRPLFPLGQIVATPGALEALSQSGESAMKFIKRHVCGDWGDVGLEDWQTNVWAVANEARLLSAYKTKFGVKLWVITEADRSSTCLLLPDEY
jgi:hypothetical protein